jgi:3-hydroxyisobutyrate dehydrogenase-like beta-hydroxyacid dehydrogenase
MSQRVAFLCLGTMGSPMAAHLAKAGYELAVYNRTRARAESWVRDFGGRVAESPAGAARERDVVLTCTGNDDDLRDIALGDHGAFAGMQPGAIFVDHTTVSAEVTRELARAATERGLEWVDAPVSGGESGAQQGVLTIMCGGAREAFERVEPLLEVYARAVTWMGPSGAGQLTKMVNQICLAGLIQSLAEGLRFAQKAGLDAKQVVEVISQGAAQSWQMDHRALSMIEDRFDFGFAVDWMRKDLGIALAEARRNGASLPVAERVDRFYAELQARGGGRLDTSSLIRLLA